jgi:hypothetical protein
LITSSELEKMVASGIFVFPDCFTVEKQAALEQREAIHKMVDIKVGYENNCFLNFQIFLLINYLCLQ